MFKDKLSKIARRIFYIVFAVIISVALWMYVEITENEMLSHEVTGIEVVLTHEDVLRDRHLLADVITDSLSVRFEASRTDINRLAVPGAITVEVDLSAITSTGFIELVFTPIWPAGVNQNDINNIVWSSNGVTINRVAINVDGLVERQVEVIATYTGGTASEYLIVDTPILDPGTIMISGPESILDRIQYAYVPILRENLTATYIDDLEFILIDDEDEMLDLELFEMLNFNHELIRVTVPVREMREFPLNVLLAHDASTSDENTIINIEPSTIMLSGDPEVIRELNTITLGTIDMLSIPEINYTLTFQIPIPNYVENVSGETEATVHVGLTGLELAFYSTSNVQVISLPPGHGVEIFTQSVDIRLRGTAEELALITPMNLRVFADVTDVGLGSSRILARVAIDGLDVNVDAVGDYFISVRIFLEE